MAEQKGMALVILGIVAIIAIIGLVLMFKGGASGAGHANLVSPDVNCMQDCSFQRSKCLEQGPNAPCVLINCRSACS